MTALHVWVSIIVWGSGDNVISRNRGESEISEQWKWLGLTVLCYGGWAKMERLTASENCSRSYWSHKPLLIHRNIIHCTCTHSNNHFKIEAVDIPNIFILK
jgi:hypothetical protein